MNGMHQHDSEQPTGFFRWNWALIGFLAVAGFFLLTEHKAHVLGVLPYLIFLLCPLMHLFHGHGGHGGHGQPTTSGKQAEPAQLPPRTGRHS